MSELPEYIFDRNETDTVITAGIKVIFIPFLIISIFGLSILLLNL